MPGVIKKEEEMHGIVRIRKEARNDYKEIKGQGIIMKEEEEVQGMLRKEVEVQVEGMLRKEVEVHGMLRKGEEVQGLIRKEGGGSKEKVRELIRKEE